MKKIAFVALLALAMASCKSKQAVLASEESAAGSKSVKEIVDGHYSNRTDFSTLYIRADAQYESPDEKYSVTADIRILKDQKILVSVRILGITLAKAYITPEKVSYYEKINKTYFEGNYALLSNWLGTELDFEKVQNLLIGKALYNLNDGSYTARIESDLYQLRSKNSGNVMKEFFFEGAGFLLKKEHIAQGGNEPRSLDIVYPAYAAHTKGNLPSKIKIDAEQKEHVTIDIDYNTVTFDENLSYPYEVPEGYEQLFID